jgi:hypothetical protein
MPTQRRLMHRNRVGRKGMGYALCRQDGEKLISVMVGRHTYKKRAIYEFASGIAGIK